jgi:hypothetical protein
VTLLFQGATLLPLVKWLGVGDPAREQREEREARALAGQAGAAAAQATHARRGSASLPANDTGRHQVLFERIAEGDLGIARAGGTGQQPQERASLAAALEAQRAVVNQLRGAGKLGSALAERLDTELDIEEMSAKGQGAHLTDGGECI